LIDRYYQLSPGTLLKGCCKVGKVRLIGLNTVYDRYCTLTVNFRNSVELVGAVSSSGLTLVVRAFLMLGTSFFTQYYWGPAIMALLFGQG
jgi:hypothetical protein